jgi:DNA replication and repair protein RecF
VIVSHLHLVNFRSYRDAAVAFGQRLNVIVGENASGKTNLLEAAYFAVRASSPRTNREEKVVRRGAAFTRVEARLADHVSEVGYAPGQGKRVRLDGVAAQSLDELRRHTGEAFIFVPESLLLIKGSPARRRAHLDAFACGLERAYAAALAQCQEALRQRNAQLLRVREGAPVALLDPWDRQLATAAVELGRRRRALVGRLAARFAPAAAALAPAAAALELRLVSHLDGTGLDEEAYLRALRARRAGEIQRASSAFGPQRDDLEVVERQDGGAERDLRVFGSQGEQRAAVLALLLAERAVAEDLTGDLGALFLDDVMSELDDARRRLLVRALCREGQSIITTTDLHYFTDDELAGARVIELPPPGAEPAGAAAADEPAGATAGATADGPVGEWPESAP